MERSRPGLIIFGDRSKGQDKNLIRTKTNLVPTIYPAGLYIKLVINYFYIFVVIIFNLLLLYQNNNKSFSFTDGYTLSSRLHDHMEWKAANYYDPKSSRHLICFVDNLNMAKVLS